MDVLKFGIWIRKKNNVDKIKIIFISTNKYFTLKELKKILEVDLLIKNDRAKNKNLNVC
jgi:hydroxymethylglutaryl-CoA reductase